MPSGIWDPLSSIIYRLRLTFPTTALVLSYLGLPLNKIPKFQKNREISGLCEIFYSNLLSTVMEIPGCSYKETVSRANFLGSFQKFYRKISRY